jgi:hypothetical protein
MEVGNMPDSRRLNLTISQVQSNMHLLCLLDPNIMSPT